MRQKTSTNKNLRTNLASKHSITSRTRVFFNNLLFVSKFTEMIESFNNWELKNSNINF